MMTTAPDEPLSEPDEEPQVTPTEEDPEEPGIGAETRPVTEPDVEGDPDIAAPNPVEDA